MRSTLVRRLRLPRSRAVHQRVVQAVMLLLALVTLSLPVLGPTGRQALAQTGTLTPPPLVNRNQLVSPVSDRYQATIAQIQSLMNLEQAAIQATLHNHGLPASDANAVASWGRPDATAELWAMIVEAIRTPEGSRSADQQNVVDWLAAASKRQSIRAAENAGYEYAEWAGLDVFGFKNLLDSNPSRDAIEAYLGSNVNNPTGYCDYRSPWPYQNEYTGYLNQTCVTPCSNPLGCPPDVPTYDQFVKWGAAEANYEFYSSGEFQQASRDIAIGVGAGVGATVAGLATVGAFIGFVNTSTTWLALFPFAGTATIAAALVGGILIVIAAIVIAVVVALDLFNALAVPGQIATLISDARASTPDLAEMLDDPNQAKSLYALFVGATIPLPRFDTCDNSIGGAAVVPCLNPTAIPAPSNSDPVFRIQEDGATTTTHSNTLTWNDTVQQATRTTRVSNTWFITSQGAPGTETQSLRIHYTDWDGVGQTAWLYNDPIAGYQFLGVADITDSSSPTNPATCVADETCFIGPTINFIGADDQRYSASVIATAPTVAPTTSANPVAGTPMTLYANGASPLGLPVTYAWQFRIPGVACITGPNCFDGAMYSDAVSGAEINHTFASSGTHTVRLTATDSLGRVTIHTFTVNVASAGAPVLVLSSTDVRTGGVDQLMSLTGTITHLGASDAVELWVDWGDGSPVNYTRQGSFPVLDICGCISLTGVAGSNPHQYTVNATHRYQQLGSYTVTVQTRDPGGEDTETTLYVIETQQTFQWPIESPITYGTAISDAQLNATMIDANGANVPGTFTYTYAIGGGTVAAGDILPAGTHTLSVSFTPEDTSATGTPAPITAQLLVERAPLTVTAPTLTVHPGETPVLDLTAADLDGFVNDEDASVLSGSLICSLADSDGNSVALAPDLPLGAYVITCQGLTSSNYDITYLDGTLTVADDSTPIVQPIVAGERGYDDWFIGDVTVTWSVDDPESGITSTEGCEPRSITADTIGTTVTCSATGPSGTTTESVTIKRDAGKPSITLSTNRSSYGLRDTVSITCTATDATSGIATNADAAFSALNPTCNNLQGPAWTYTSGVNTIDALTADRAGNLATATARFTVTATHDQLCALTRQLVSNSLTAAAACVTLIPALLAERSRLHSVEAAMLTAYRTTIEAAQRRGQISATNAGILQDWSRTL